MALDSAVVAQPAPDEITLRIYGWKPVSLSLGALAPLAAVSKEWRARVPVLRRPTSGGLMYHDEKEIAFCLGGRVEAITPSASDLECACQRAVKVVVREMGEHDSGPSSIESVLRVSQKREQDTWLLQGFVALAGHLDQGELPERVRGPALMPDAEAIQARQETMRRLADALASEFDVAWSDATAEPHELVLANRLLAERFGSKRWLERT